MRIREFILDDYGAARRLWEQAPGLGPVPLDDVERKLERDPDLFLVVEHLKALVAVVMGSYDGRRGWIFRLAVDQSDRQHLPGSRRPRRPLWPLRDAIVDSPVGPGASRMQPARSASTTCRHLIVASTAPAPGWSAAAPATATTPAR